MRKIIRFIQEQKNDLLFTESPEYFLKCCLHAHTNERGIRYKPGDLIKVAKKRGYDVLSITEHGSVYFTEELRELADETGVLLIPGTEAYVGERKSHVLILNSENYPPQEKMKKMEDFAAWVKNDSDRKNTLVIAPHPFYLKKCSLGDDLENYIDIFDAVEFSFFRPPSEPNRKAVEIAKKYNKPIVGTGDIHRLWQLGTTFCLIKSEKKRESIVRTIKESTFTDCYIENYFESCPYYYDKRIITQTRYLSLWEFFGVISRMLESALRKL